MRTASVEPIGPPSKALLARELLSWPELGAFAASMPWWALGPRGDGHPVRVLPGLAVSDGSTLPMRTFLASQGEGRLASVRARPSPAMDDPATLTARDPSKKINDTRRQR